MNIRICFFGTPIYSVLVLDKLFKNNYQIVCVVTKPPQIVGRDKILTQTESAIWTKTHNIPLLTPPSNPQKPTLFLDENKLTGEVLQFQPNLIIAADYTQKIPIKLIDQMEFAGLNVHPSLLPKYRGPAPIPWTLIKGEKETGITILTLTDEFDAGKTIAQEKITIKDTDTTPILLEKLFTQGADLLIKILPKYITSTMNYELSTINSPSYYPRLTREIGFIPWKILEAAIKGLPFPENQISNWPIAKYFDKTFIIHHSSFIIHNSYRGLNPWPGIWTKVKINGQEKRLKILKINLNQSTINHQQLTIDAIQLEGKNPISGKDAQEFLKQIIS